MFKRSLARGRVEGTDFFVGLVVTGREISVAGTDLGQAQAIPVRVRGAIRTRGATGAGAGTRISDTLQIEGTVGGARVTLMAQKLADSGVAVKARARRGEDRLRIEFWSADEGYLGTDSAQFVGPVCEALMLLFRSKEAGPESIGRISFQGDVGPAPPPVWESDMDPIEKVQLTDKAWSSYEKWHAGGCKEILWDEPIPGLACCRDSHMLQIAKSLRMASPWGVIPVLLLGESGTGKELLANAIHAWSKRTGPFKSVNCGGLAPEDARSELFGHIKGAFTGAFYDRKGAFHYAHMGTLFLDEIGEMPFKVQTQLLRTIESGKVVRMGSDEEKEVDVRLVAATNRNLQASVGDGSFREDLYARLNVFPIRLPPLRRRVQDIPALIAFLTARPPLSRKSQRRTGERISIQASEEKRPVVRFGEGLYKSLLWYPWPRNVRELEHFIEIATLLSRDRVDPFDWKDLKLEGFDIELRAQLPVAFEHYKKAAERIAIGDADQKVISIITGIARDMFSQCWAALDTQDREEGEKRWRGAITEAKEAVRASLADVRSAPPELEAEVDALEEKPALKQLLLTGKIKDRMLSEGAVVDIVRQVYRSLCESRIKLSHERERPGRHATFREFFGMEYDAVRYQEKKEKRRAALG